MIHVCPVTGCSAECPEHKIMCPEHWRLVPVETQHAVWRTWRDTKRARRLSATAFKTAWGYYLAARQAAIDAVHRALEACA